MGFSFEPSTKKQVHTEIGIVLPLLCCVIQIAVTLFGQI